MISLNQAAVFRGVVGVLLLLPSLGAQAETPRRISGIDPKLAVYNLEGECGTGAVVPWQDRLWVITYAPHKPQGSTDKLYEITPDFQQIVRKESVGGTPANRMIHKESQQLFIGPYVIDSSRNVRAIPPSKMYGRLTGNARHLFDPANKIYFATMEEGIYEVDVRSLEIKELWTDEQRKNGHQAKLPGYHGKGLYSGQGRLVYANNGEHGPEALTRPEIPSGVLASWDGKSDAWTIVRRNQFTEVTGPGGIFGNTNPESDPIWSIGWDHRSLILQVLWEGKWHAYRLPKSSHSYDGAHGWNTEWPRIRDIGEEDLLMTMHGAFWRFPKELRPGNSAGIVPRSNYLKVIGDFCRWGDDVVLGCDDAAHSEFLNKRKLKGKTIPAGQAHSNLVFLKPEMLDRFGPVIGRGAAWREEDVAAGTISDPFLFSGYDKRTLQLSHKTNQPVEIRIEIDRTGAGEWTLLKTATLSTGGANWMAFPEQERGVWVRLTPSADVKSLSAVFQYANNDRRPNEPASIFDGIAKANDDDVTGGLLHARGQEMRTLRFVAHDSQGNVGGYELNGDLKLVRVDDAAADQYVEKNLAVPQNVIDEDAASILYVDDAGRRWRLPKGNSSSIPIPAPLGPARICREVCTERDLLNIGGTFFELPAENAGGFAKLRPVATHNHQISDFTSYRGLLVMSGVKRKANNPDHLIQSEDGRCSLWVGSVDDLWSFGKPRGSGGPWTQTAVPPNVPSDPYLMTGYDQKQVFLSHTSPASVTFTLEVDLTGDGLWTTWKDIPVPPGKTVEYIFPEEFNAYWVRVKSNKSTIATAKFEYR